MRQITLREPGSFVSDDVAPPAASEGHALVRPHRIGVCGTDLHAFAGRQPFFTYPRILGHELGVEILDAPQGSGVRVGSRCAVEPYLSCGVCHACGIGKPNCCERLRVLGVHTDGGMRGIISVPVEKLHASDALTYDQLALVETLGIGQHAVERSNIRAGETALVVGAGPIGLAVIQFAKTAGAKVGVLDVSEERRAFASTFGVEAVAATDGVLYDVVFDATGNARAMEASFQHVAFGGKLVFVGIVMDKIAFEDPHFHRRELTLLASRNSCDAFPSIMGQIERGEIDTAPWITHRLGLAEVPEKFADLPKSRGLVKAMIEVDDADA